jgi:mRNA interferase HicA
MKRHEFLRHLRVNGCILKREGAKHSLYINSINGVVETVPWHVEIDNRLAKKICNRLGIPEP